LINNPALHIKASVAFLQAFDEAIQDGVDINSKLRIGSQRLVLDSAPLPLTETVTTQPFNRDRLVFEEQSPDGWLY